MSVRGVSSILRIAVLAVLVIAATAGEGQLAAVQPQVPSPEVALITPSPTVEMVVSPQPTATMTPSPSPTIAPTREPTTAPTPTPESARSDFAVPENTTDSSIIVERGPTDKAYVALTFDAGEGRGYTEEILDFLQERGLHASFGTTGAWARENPDLILRILDEGHLLFNHSESHLSWTGETTGAEPLSDEDRTSEVLGADEAVQDVADWSMKPFWRPPYGAWDPEGQVLLKSLGYDYTFWWTCDSLGWNGQTAAEIVEWCAPDTERGGYGAIILFHVSQEQDYLSLPGIVDAYEAEGYQIVTMDQMIGS